jgi:hypothetical protein
MICTIEELKGALQQLMEERAGADSLRLDKEVQLSIMGIEGLPNTLWVTLGMIIMERRIKP